MKPSSLLSYNSLHGLPASAIHVFVIFKRYIINFVYVIHTLLGSLLHLSGYLTAVCRYTAEFVYVINSLYALSLSLVVILFLLYSSYVQFCVCNYIVIILFYCLCCYVPTIFFILLKPL